jgi:hypothetical protein
MYNLATISIDSMQILKEVDTSNNSVNGNNILAGTKTHFVLKYMLQHEK